MASSIASERSAADLDTSLQLLSSPLLRGVKDVDEIRFNSCPFSVEDKILAGRYIDKHYRHKWESMKREKIDPIVLSDAEKTIRASDLRRMPNSVIQSIIELSRKRIKEQNSEPIEVLGVVLQPKIQTILNTLPEATKKKILQATKSAKPRDVEKFVVNQIQEHTGSLFDSELGSKNQEEAVFNRLPPTEQQEREITRSRIVQMEVGQESDVMKHYEGGNERAFERKVAEIVHEKYQQHKSAASNRRVDIFKTNEVYRFDIWKHKTEQSVNYRKI